MTLIQKTLFAAAALTLSTATFAEDVSAYDQADIDQFVDFAVGCVIESAQRELTDDAEKAMILNMGATMKESLAKEVPTQLAKHDISAEDFKSCLAVLENSSCEVMEQAVPPKGCEALR